jgi:hypothetical protein
MTISNQPPPFEAHSLNIEELVAQAQDYLDGEPIASQGQADDVGKLLDMIRLARKAADEQRALEKKPHDEAAKAVQTQWKPLLDRCDTAATVAKRALTPWLAKVETEQREAAEKARQEALEKQQAALDAQRAALATNDLKTAEEAKALTKEADFATRAANKAEKAKPQATGGARAVGLRTSWTAEVTDYVAFGRWLWTNHPDEYRKMLDDFAGSFTVVRPAIPGIIYHQERTAA